MRTLVLDPGLKMGLATFDGIELLTQHAYTAKGKTWEEKTRDITDYLINTWPYWEPHMTFIEWPTMHFRGNIKSVLKLCFLIGRIVEAWPGKITLIPVHKWRGTIPKEVLWRRAEKYFKLKKPLQADAGDAVALGLFLIKNNDIY